MNSYNDKFQKKVEEEDSLDDFDDFLKTSPSEDEFFLENNDLIDKSKQTKGSDDKTIPGLVYISNLPPKMTPLYIRQIFSKYGEVGRVYLQPDDQKSRRSKKQVKNSLCHGRYTEGWIEFADKKLAKKIVLAFNNTHIVDGKKRIFRNYTWNLKYLHRFRWTHLTEHFRQQQQTHRQKMRIEISQAKREANAYAANATKSKSIAAIKMKREKKGEVWNERRRPVNYRQRRTVEQLRQEKLQKLNDDVTDQLSNEKGNPMNRLFCVT